MKTIFTSFVILFVLAACDTKDEEPEVDRADFYELRYISTGLSGQIIEKEDLDYIEHIEFFSDSTFIKQRTYLDSTSIASGNYMHLEKYEYDYLKLTYDNHTYLIQSCGNTLDEYVRILGENEIFNGSYLPCDGPGYYYVRKNK